MVDIQPHPRGAVLRVKARAGARRSGVTGARQGELLVSVTQPPEKGKANAAIVKLLAATLGVRPSDIELRSGASSPRKQFLVVGATVEGLGHAVAESLSGPRGGGNR